MAHTYILHSKAINKFYVGACSKNLEERIAAHNSGKYGSKSFSHIANDWELKVSFDCINYSHAIRLEKKIKSMKSKVYIQNLIKCPELRTKIFGQTKCI